MPPEEDVSLYAHHCKSRTSSHSIPWCRSSDKDVKSQPAPAPHSALPTPASPASAPPTQSLSTADTEVAPLIETTEPAAAATAAAGKAAKAASAMVAAVPGPSVPLSKSQQRKARLAQKQEEMRLKGVQSHQAAGTDAAKPPQQM